MSDTCPNLKYPIFKNRVLDSDFSEAVDAGLVGPDFSPKVCGFDLTEAKQAAEEAGVPLLRCPECGRKLS